MLLTILFSLNGYCIKNIDSLENLINKVSVEEKITILNKLAFHYRVNNPEKTLDYAFEAFQLSELNLDQEAKHSALSNLGMGYRYLGKYDEALEYQLKALDVADTGIGIKQEDLYRLFSINDHLHSKGTANEDGSGLGLILCKEFVEINGGKIWAESKYGKESKFKFTLPSN